MQLIWCLLSNFISTCFGHHYAHHQENKSVHCRIWCSALVVMAVVVWSWDASCVHCESYCSRARVPAPHNHSHHQQCRTPYAAVHTLVLLMMGIMMPETCWDKSLIINIRLVASSWFLSPHPTFMMHSHKGLKFSRFVLTHDSNAQTESSSKVWEISEDGILNIAHCDLNLIMLYVVQQHINICSWTTIFSLGWHVH